MTKEILISTLAKSINHTHSQLMAELLIDCLLTTENGEEEYKKAVMGHKSSLSDFGVEMFDRVPIAYERTWTSLSNRKLMIEAGMLLNNTVEAQIIGFNPLDSKPIVIEYMYISNSIYNLHQKHEMKIASSDFINKNKKDEKINNNDDLPF